VAVQKTAEDVNKNIGTVELVLDEHLNVKKICAKIVLKNLSDSKFIWICMQD
jgi:hypothetical protein